MSLSTTLERGTPDLVHQLGFTLADWPKELPAFCLCPEPFFVLIMVLQ